MSSFRSEPRSEAAVETLKPVDRIGAAAPRLHASRLFRPGDRNRLLSLFFFCRRGSLPYYNFGPWRIW